MTFHGTLSAGGSEFNLFRALDSVNRCLPGVRRWAHYLLHAQARWRAYRRKTSDEIKLTPRDERAMFVTFIRPHPLYLASLGDWTQGNIFPLNLVGDLGDGCVGLALRERRMAADLVERAGRIALSGIPLSKCSVAFQLAGNHRKESVDWAQLRFEMMPSATLGIPVPAFATRVRELRIESVHHAGSHRFFVARTISNQTNTTESQACVIHGFYQCWRLRGNKARLRSSVLEDAINKRYNSEPRP